MTWQESEEEDEEEEGDGGLAPVQTLAEFLLLAILELHYTTNSQSYV